MATKKQTTKTKRANTWSVTHVPITSWILFWALVLTTMALAYLCFTRAFIAPPAPVPDQASVNDYQALADSLEKQVKEMEAQAAAEAIPAPVVARCDMSDASAPIDNYVTYSDEERTFTVKLPYSTGWSSADCPVAPAVIVSGHVLEFGPYAGQHEMEYPERDARLVSSDQIMTTAELKNKLQGSQEGTLQNLRQRTINGIPVFSYSLLYAHGVTRNYWEALGRTYSYKISSEGWLTDAEAVKIIQSLRVTK